LIMTFTVDRSFPVREALRLMEPYTLEPRAAEVKLDQNEAAAGDPGFAEELARRIARRDLRRYPDFEATRVREAIASFHGLAAENVLAGNGSNELLLTAFATFVAPGTRLVVPSPSFALYEKLGTVFGAEIVPVPFDPAAGTLPVDEICARAGGSVVALCSPNNPTGAWLRPGELDRILAAGAFVLLDRAYGEFAGDPVPPLHDRLVTFSTFSKAWGLAALRVGWAASTTENCRAMRKVKLPYNLGVAGEEAALLALERARQVDERVRATVAERERVREALASIDGLTPFPSRANFVAFRVASGAEALFERLASRGVLVRDVSRAPGMAGCLRVSIGSRDENDRFLDALCAPRRTARVARRTKETSVEVTVDLDGTGPSRIRTPVGFLSHMLDTVARHARLTLDVEVEGDVEIDYHHTVEDTALVLGEAVRRALGDKTGIRRFGHAYVPLDESLARVVVDLSGRPYLAFEVPLDREMLLVHRDFPFALVEEFFKSFANTCGCNVHVDLLRGRNGHHAAEAIFKAFAVALRSAKEVVADDVPSTKGVI
jgi:histidinol-phosphate aminotransferase